jgi:hypothetical protein
MQRTTCSVSQEATMRVLAFGSAALLLIGAAPVSSDYARTNRTPVVSRATDQDSLGKEIVVTGKREKFVQDLRDVRGISVDHDRQMARFETDVCPLVLGLPRPFAAAVELRIREIAAQVGAHAAQGDCQPNLTVFIADDTHAFLSLLKSRQPMLFATTSKSELARLDRSSGPVLNWYSVDPKRRDGGPVEHISELSIDGGAPVPVSDHAYIATNVEMSRLSSSIRVDIMLAFIIIDRDAIDGLTLQQIGDFSAFMGLSMINYDHVTSLHRNSILRVIKDSSGADAGPQEITRFDLAYLQALYAGSAADSWDRGAALIASTLHPSLRKPN